MDQEKEKRLKNRHCLHPTFTFGPQITLVSTWSEIDTSPVSGSKIGIQPQLGSANCPIKRRKPSPGRGRRASARGGEGFSEWGSPMLSCGEFGSRSVEEPTAAPKTEAAAKAVAGPEICLNLFRVRFVLCFVLGMIDRSIVLLTIVVKYFRHDTNRSHVSCQNPCRTWSLYNRNHMCIYV